MRSLLMFAAVMCLSFVRKIAKIFFFFLYWEFMTTLKELNNPPFPYNTDQHEKIHQKVAHNTSDNMFGI